MQRACVRLLRSVKRFYASKVKAKTGDESIIDEDRIRLVLRAGAGGPGLARYNGVGGVGGSIYLVGRPNLNFHAARKLLKGETMIKAACGEPSLQTKLIATKGADTMIYMPIGVEAVNTETNVLIARSRVPNRRHLLARGGMGGCEQNNYNGLRGEGLFVDFHLKLRPNIGLVGLPNAGKSTLMKALVPKKSIKIASYPFTTTKPQFCHVRNFEDGQPGNSERAFSLSIADLPGIVEGASSNRGKGALFLKHLEYSDILLLVIDVKGFQLRATLSEPFRSALESVAILMYEMERFDPHLISKPAVLAINKIDLPQGEQIAAELTATLSRPDWPNLVSEEFRPRHTLRFEAIIPMIAKEGRVGNLKQTLLGLYKFLHPLTDLPDDAMADSTHSRLV